jgi:hypothetical protein
MMKVIGWIFFIVFLIVFAVLPRIPFKCKLCKGKGTITAGKGKDQLEIMCCACSGRGKL